MHISIDRRTFLKSGSLAASGLAFSGAATAWASSAKPDRKITKSLKFGMIGQGKTFEEKLQVAKDAGFDSVEPDTLFDPRKVEQLRKASEKVGVPVDAIICSRHWSHPLSDPDLDKVKTCVNAMRVSMENVKALGGDMVLLVPAVVKSNVMYKDAYKQSLKVIKQEIVPIASEMDVVVGLENVWNKFLLSPIEFRAYIEEIDSPYVKAWFDVGNIVAYGYPQDWIRTLREQIVRVDLKDFHAGKHQFVPLRKGSVNWKEVMRALDEIKFEGIFAAEVAGGDLNHLTNVVSKPMDVIIAES